jgi:hypothetical protein
LLRSFSSVFQRTLLTSAVAGAGELLREEARREGCRRERSDFFEDDEGSMMIGVALRQIALAATVPGAARRGAALAEQRDEKIMLACMAIR